MKWIVLAGSSDTRKTWTLTELVIALVKTSGAKLVSPTLLPMPHHPVTQNGLPYYNDGTYELRHHGKVIVVKTDGDMPGMVGDGFKKAKALNADIYISAAHARSGSGHVTTIDNIISSNLAEVFVIGALNHDNDTKPAVVKWRVRQIIDML